MLNMLNMFRTKQDRDNQVQITSLSSAEKELKELEDLVKRFTYVVLPQQDSWYHIPALHQFKFHVEELEKKAAAEAEYKKVKEMVYRALQERSIIDVDQLKKVQNP